MTAAGVHAPTPTPEDAATMVKARARELGFSAVGIASVEDGIAEDFARYRAALDAGLHGPIEYLARNVDVRGRVDAPGILAGAKSVIVVAARYDRRDEEGDPPVARAIARYARGRDYHNHLRKKLRALARTVRALGENVEARPTSDTAPILEKAWAARAGVGFFAKNGLVIVPGEGSFVLLGEVVTTLALPADTPIEERCGRCTLCLDACPTRAFVRPFVLDAGRCVATMTIELRGPVPDELREATGEHLFGCDVCQDVCPHNHARRPAPPLADRYRPHARWSEVTIEDLARVGMVGGPDFAEATEGSPVRRAGVEGLARNACLVLGRERRVAALAVLEDVAARHPSDVVRDAARWAIDRIARRDAKATMCLARSS